MSEITDTLTAKVGPFPTWVYGVGLGLGVLGVLALVKPKPKAEADPAAGVAEAATPPLAGENDPFVLSPSHMGGGTWAVAPRDSTSGGDDDLEDEPKFANDDAWRRAATDWAIGAGYPPITVSDALGKAINGEELDPAEVAIVSTVLRQIGPPPSGLPPIRQRAQTPQAPPIERPSAPAQPGRPYDARAQWEDIKAEAANPSFWSTLPEESTAIYLGLGLNPPAGVITPQRRNHLIQQYADSITIARSQLRAAGVSV